MRQEIGRRAFVSSVVAGVPLLADVTFARAQAAGAVAHVHTADPVQEELLRQLRVATKALQATGKAEHARTIASVLRLEVAHAAGMRLDASWKQGLDERVRTHGVASILNQEIDVQRWQSEAASFGSTETNPPFVSTADRQKGLNAILAAGVTPSLLRAAAELEARAPALARDAQHGGVRAVRYDCGSLNQMISIIQWEMAIACALAYIDGGIACDFLVGTYVGLQAMAWWYGC